MTSNPLPSSRTLVIRLLSVVVLALLVASCAPVEAPKEKIVIAMPADIDTLDVQVFKSIPGYYAVRNVHEQLIDPKLEPYGDHLAWEDPNEFVGALAERWDVSEDGKTITFHLRDGLKFSNGNPLTASDVYYTFDRALNGGGYTAILLGMLTVDNVEEQVKVLDDKTVEITLREVNPMATKLLGLNVVSILDEETMKEHATADDPWANEWAAANTIGAGPYVLKEWTPGVGWELEPNPNYWNAEAIQNAGIIVKQVDDAQDRLALLKSGAVDVAFDIAYKDLEDLQNDPNIEVVTKPSTWNWYLGMVTTVPPFDNLKVRQAVAYAIPYDTIIDDVMHGFAVSSRGPVVPNMPTSDPEFWNYDTDLEKAKQLLTEAGYPDGFDTQMDVLVGRIEDEEAAVWIQANLAEIGVNVELNKQAAAQYYDRLNAKEHPMFIAEWFSWVNDPFYHMTWHFKSDSVFTNATNYANPTVDELISSGIYEADSAKREEISKELQEIIVEDSPWGFLFARNFIVSVRNTIKGYAIYPDQNPRWMDLEKLSE